MTDNKLILSFNAEVAIFDIVEDKDGYPDKIKEYEVSSDPQDQALLIKFTEMLLNHSIQKYLYF